MESQHTMRDHLGNVVSLPEDARQQVLGYIKHQGAKGPGEILALVERFERLLGDALAGVTEAQARFSPSPSEWSIREVLRHVDSAVRGTTAIVTAISEGRARVSMGDSPPVGEGAEVSLDEVKQCVGGGLEELKSTVRALGEGGDLAATARHPFFDDLNWKEWTVFAYVHGRDHVDQINKVKADPNYPA